MQRRLLTYAGPVSGILFAVVPIVGLAIHGYPSGSGADIKHWVATTDANRFAIGIWLEGIGYLFFLPFAAWLVRGLRRPDAPAWPADVAMGAAVLVTGSVLINGTWSGLVDAARAGADAGVLQALKYVASDGYIASIPFSGLFALAAGVLALTSVALPKWLGWAAVVIGVLCLIPPVSMPASVALLLWVLVVSVWSLVRLRGGRGLGLAGP